MAVKGIYGLQGRSRVRRSGGYQTITGYYNNASSGRFCANDVNTSFTIYTSTHTTLANIYSNGANIYNNTGLSSLASAGFYGAQNGGSGAVWYEWSGTAWTNNGVCA